MGGAECDQLGKVALDEEMGDAEMEASLLEAFAKAIGRKVDELPPVVSQAASVWPYGTWTTRWRGGCVWKADMRLALAGDWAYNGVQVLGWRRRRAARPCAVIGCALGFLQYVL